MRRTPKPILAAIASGALLLTACGGDTAPEPPASTTAARAETGSTGQEPSAETPTEPAERVPDAYRGTVIDVVAADTFRVQVTEELFGPASDREAVEVEPWTTVVKTPVYDAPARGECGFEEARGFLITDLFGQEGPDFDATAEQRVRVTLDRSAGYFAELPEADADGNELYGVSYQRGGRTLMEVLNQGYGTAGEMLSADAPGTAVYQEAQDTAERAGKGLWGSCFGQ